MKKVYTALTVLALFATSLDTSVAEPAFTQRLSEGTGLALRGLVSARDGGYLLLGRTSLAGYAHDACVIKLDASGNVLWSTAVGSTAEEDPAAFVETSSGDIVGCIVRLGGDPTQVAAEDAWGNNTVFCLSPDGKLRWCKTTGLSLGRSIGIVETRDGSFAIVAQRNYGTVALVTLDHEGALVSSALLSPKKDNTISDNQSATELWARRILATGDGGLLIGGDLIANRTAGQTSSRERLCALVKLRADREVEWSLSYRIPGSLAAVTEAEDGFVASTATTDPPFPTTVFKVDRSGALVWSRAYVPAQGGQRLSAVLGATTFPDGRIVLVRGDYRAMVVDPTGQIVEQRDVADTLDGYAPLSGGSRLAVVAARDSAIVMAWASDWWNPTYKNPDELPILGKTTPFDVPAAEPTDQEPAVMVAAPWPTIEVLPVATEVREAALYNSYGSRGDQQRETGIDAREFPSDRSARFQKMVDVMEGSQISRRLIFADAVALGGNAAIAIGENDYIGLGVCLLKLDGKGGIQDKLFLDMESSAHATQLLKTDHHTILVLGAATINGGETTWLAEMDEGLGLHWRTSIGGVQDLPKKVVAVGDGYLVLCTTQSYGLRHPSLLLSRLDARGGVRWIRTLGGALDLGAVDLTAAADGGAYITASERAGPQKARDIIVLRVDPAGAVTWQQRLGGPLDDEALCASPAKDGGVQLLFRTGPVDKDEESRLGMVAFDGRGRTVGQWQFQTNGPAWFWHARPTPTGGFLLAWSNDTPDGKGQVELRSIDPDGSQAWSIALPNVVDLAPSATAGSGSILATAYYDTPEWINEMTNGFEAPLVVSLNETAVRQRKDLAPLSREARSLVSVKPAALKAADQPTTGYSARVLDGAMVSDFQKTRVKMVSTSGLHTLAVLEDGSLWAFGRNDHGQLGNGTTTNSRTPVKVMDGVRSATARSSCSFALKTDGTLWVFGRNQYGCLGDGTTQEHSVPVQVMGDVTAVDSSGWHTLVVKTDGTLWTVGLNHHGQLGDGTTQNRATLVQVMDGVKAVAAVADHSFALRVDGTLWAFGSGAMRQLGDGDTTDHVSPVPVLTDVAAVSADGATCATIRTDGTLWYVKDLEPVGWPLIRGLPVKEVAAMATSYSHTLVIKADRSVWAFGQNESGQLGKAAPPDSSQELVHVMENGALLAAARGESLVVKVDGTLWAFGDNGEGALGEKETRHGPVEIAFGGAAPNASTVNPEDQPLRLPLQARCTEANVRVRAEPNLQAQTVAHLNQGDAVDIMDRSPEKMKIQNMEAYWYRVRNQRYGITGWVYGFFLKLDQH